MSDPAPTPLESLAVVVNPDHDDVAVARQPLPAGTRLASTRFGDLTLAADIPMGHRFALRPVAAGGWIHQYGQPFARSKGLRPGDPVNADTTLNEVPHVDADSLDLRTPTLPPWEGPRPTFMGYRRPDGRVGVRNWVLVVPTSMCSSHEASTIALRAEMSRLYSRDKYPNVDGVTAIPHTRGCGCPDYEPRASADQLTGVVEASMRMLGRYIEHPNVGAVLIIELGCEKTNLSAVGKYLALAPQGPVTSVTGSHARGASLVDFGKRHGKPVLTMSVQNAGGTLATIQRGLELLPALLEAANQTPRTECDASDLVIGLKCGGSDAFSGLTANPALGHASDLLVRAGATTIITEIPEFFGAEHLFAARARDRNVASQIFAAMIRFRRYVDRVGGSMSENPSPGNKEGGLLNITIKSLGALAKSGTAPVQGVLDYAQSVWDNPPSSILHPPSSSSPASRARGLHLLYCPSYDQESTPALVASGCQIVCFTTGRGTGIGNAIAPVLKIGSNTPLFTRMSGDLDYNAGPILDGTVTLPQAGQDLLNLILSTASGHPTKSEHSGHREFMIWSEEAVSL
jgi:altronate hydrolase